MLTSVSLLQNTINIFIKNYFIPEANKFSLFASIPFNDPIMYFANVLVYEVVVTNVEAITKLGVIKLD